MACRNAYKTQNIITEVDIAQTSISEPVVAQSVNRLLFGVDSNVKSNTVLQNNLTMFEWVVRNKRYPAFWGRNIVGENALDKEEMGFLQNNGCQIAPIYCISSTDTSEEQGKIEAQTAVDRAIELGIAGGIAIFIEIPEHFKISREYMQSYAQVLLDNGYTPGFKANTDAKYDFDREFSRGMQEDKEVFLKCLVWAVDPSLKEFDSITTSHVIAPNNWNPFAPSAITRRDIAIWQYGKNCHPIEDNNENETIFNVDLIKNDDILFEKIL